MKGSSAVLRICFCASGSISDQGKKVVIFSLTRPMARLILSVPPFDSNQARASANSDLGRPSGVSRYGTRDDIVFRLSLEEEPGWWGHGEGWDFCVGP